MLIPDFQAIMLPLLECLKGGEMQIMDKIEDLLAAYFELTEEALDEQAQTAFQTNILEAFAHLKKAGLLAEIEVGFKITSLGKQIVKRRLNGIDIQYLRRLPGYLD